ncbi:hypothetical protein [Erythrobacter sp. F6033]|uniref:hypothetical protein n=1 Tax=Erythrobacter sp. F6033 TaxID=2926401 RepID=UPI001FF62514|nr:hypothetical protein [Erythrobacter sp. F6033]MCK0127199.1 hypothetical protein [Erythrobacter sp. F6033]
MPAGPTWLGLFAAGVYAVVIAAVIFAAISAITFKQRTADILVWLGIALMFVALIGLRIFDVENLVRDELRTIIIGDGLYDDRRDYQRWIAAIVLLLSSLVGIFAFVKRMRGNHGRRELTITIGIGACAAMVLLIVLRLISLHSIDALLYGPVKLNWIGDLGLSVLVAASALYYVKLVRSRS